MVNLITMQQTAEKIGIRKGTLCMWRNRKKFPFKTKGTGRNLMVDETSVDEWLKEHKDDVLKGRNRPRKPMAKKARKAPAARKVRAVGRRKVGRPARRGPAASKSLDVMVKGNLDLGAIQGFVDAIKAGHAVQIAPAKGGYTLTTTPA